MFVVEQKPHERFERDGNDLITHLNLSLVDALTGPGGSRTVEGFAGKKINVKVPPAIVKPGAETRVTGEGMPIRKDGATRTNGDLVVKWDIAFPDRLTPSQKDGLRKVLG